MKTRTRYWFKAKLYGWGWYPATWEGWLTLLIYIGITVLNFHRLDSMSHSVSDMLINYLPQTFLLTLVLIGICCLTGEKPRWRWGK